MKYNERNGPKLYEISSYVYLIKTKCAVWLIQTSSKQGRRETLRLQDLWKILSMWRPRTETFCWSVSIHSREEHKSYVQLEEFSKWTHPVYQHPDQETNYGTPKSPLLTPLGHNLPPPRVTTILTPNGIELFLKVSRTVE